MSNPFKSTVLLLAALSSAGCIQGSGRVVSQSRTFSSIHAIDSRGVAEVTVVAGNGSIDVVADDNLIDFITTTVVDGTLIIDEKPNALVQSLHTIEVHVSTPTPLTKLTVSGSGSLASMDPALQTVEHLALELSGSGSMHTAVAVTTLVDEVSGSGSLDVSGRADQSLHTLSGSGGVTAALTGSTVAATVDGAGSAKLSGSANDGSFVVSGTGSVYAFAVPFQRVSANLSGTGGVEVSVAQKLDVDVSGTGSLSYRGTPEVTKHLSGSGGVVSVP